MGKGLSIDEMMQKALEIPGLLSLAAGFTDNTIMPRAAVLQTVEELLEQRGAVEVLQYGNPMGRTKLRTLLAHYVMRLDHESGVEPGLVVADDLIMTNGSQQALFLASSALCQPGDIILVESPTYFVYLDLLRNLGIRAIALPSQNDTIDTAALPEFFANLKRSPDFERVRAVYVVSYFANPSSLSLTFAQKSELVRAMQQAGLAVPVIEDVAYREFYFDKPWPASSMLCLETPEIPIMLAGTLTKSFSTGLKVGYGVVRNAELRQRMVDLKRCHDFGTGNFVQAILEHVIENGEFAAFLRAMRPKYGEKCRTLHQALLANGLQELGWQWQESQGSLYLWLTAPNGVLTDADSPLYRACIEEKVLIVPGSLCCPTAGHNKVRLSFGGLPLSELAEAAARFVRAARRVSQSIVG